MTESKTSGNKRRIFLVDDHPMLRDGLRRLIEQVPDCTVSGEAASASEAMEQIEKNIPDLVVMDISLPDKTGLDMIKDLHALDPKLKILVFSMHDEMVYAERTLKAGSKGYLMKGADSGLLVNAVKRVLNHGIYLSPRVADHLLRNISGGGKIGNRLQVLTDRELEVFELIGRCYANSQISDQLNISPKTVDAHRANIKTKLNLPDAPSLLREAILWIELAKEPRP